MHSAAKGHGIYRMTWEQGKDIVIGASITGVANLGRNWEMRMSMNSQAREAEKRFHYHRHFESMLIFLFASFPGWIHQ